MAKSRRLVVQSQTKNLDTVPDRLAANAAERRLVTTVVQTENELHKPSEIRPLIEDRVLIEWEREMIELQVPSEIRGMSEHQRVRPL